MSTLLNLDTFRHEFYDQPIVSSSPTYSHFSMESSSQSDGKYSTHSPSSSSSNMSPMSTNSDPSYNIQNLNITPNYEISYFNAQHQMPVYSYAPTDCNASPTVVLSVPNLVILEQPVDKFRFRYQSEMHGTHGSLMGIKNEKSKKTFPTVELRGFQGEAKVRCSLYQVDQGRRNAHSHHLVIKNGDLDLNDPHDIDVSSDKGYKAVFQGMGIIHTAKKNIAEELYKKMKKQKAVELNRDLTLREEHQLLKETTEQAKTMNLNQVCLCFQAFRVDKITGSWLPLCEPVFSNAINNMKSALTGDLKICRLSTAVSSVDGGEEVFMFVEKVCKNNIKIRFYETDEYDQEIWHDWGTFSEVDVHHQYAIAFKTPPYRNKEINESAEVYIQLYRPRDKRSSEPVSFKYKPHNMCSNSSRKRQRVSSVCLSNELPTVIADTTTPNGFYDDFSCNKDIPTTVANDITFTSNDFKYFVDFNPEDFNTLLLEIGGNQELNKLETDSSVDRPNENNVDNLLNIYLNKNKDADDSNALKKILTIIKMFHRDAGKCRKLITALWLTSNKNGINCLHTAIENDEDAVAIKLVDMLVELKLHELLNTANERNETSLHVAISNGRYELIRKLIKAGSNVNCCDFNGNSALHRAVKEGSAKCVEEILASCSAKNKIKIDATNDDGLTALHLAIRLKDLKIMRKLLDNGASHRLKDLKHGNNILHMSVENESFDLVKSILETVDKTLADEPNNPGYTPLQLAYASSSSSSTSKAIVCELLKYQPEVKKIEAVNQNENEDVDIEEADEDNEEDDDNSSEASILSAMNLTCDKAEVIHLLENHIPRQKCVIKEAAKEKVNENEAKSLFDEVCLTRLSQLLNVDDLWKRLASLLELDAYVSVWEMSTNPAEMLFNFVEMQDMPLENIVGIFEALDLREAIKHVDEMICRHMK